MPISRMLSTRLSPKPRSTAGRKRMRMFFLASSANSLVLAAVSTASPQMMTCCTESESTRRGSRSVENIFSPGHLGADQRRVVVDEGQRVAAAVGAQRGRELPAHRAGAVDQRPHPVGVPVRLGAEQAAGSHAADADQHDADQRIDRRIERGTC